MEKIQHECQSCGYVVPKWLGHCSKCNSWNSFLEIKEVLKKKKLKNTKYKKLPDVVSADNLKIKTNIKELDRVLGDGLTLGSLILIGGSPGVGKSTLLLNMAYEISKSFHEKKIFYVSGEESESQVSQRSKRLDINSENIYFLNETSLEEIKISADKLKPSILIIDSIQTTYSEDLNSSPGNISQIRLVTNEIMNYCKKKRITTFIVGHITKDGSLSGPKVLEHMVDTVLYFEGDKENDLRILRCIKNRFGSTDEIGLFEMTQKGIKSLNDPSEMFIDANLKKSFGRSTAAILEGSRVIFIESQALVNENKFSNGRRTTQGFDSNRLSMLVAIIEKYFNISLSFFDIFVNIVGGIKIAKKELDLSIIVSILSSYFKTPIDPHCLFMGEVGLTGEIRKLHKMEKRIKEIEAYNYSTLVTGNYNLTFESKKIVIQKINLVSELNNFFPKFLES